MSFPARISNLTHTPSRVFRARPTGVHHPHGLVQKHATVDELPKRPFGSFRVDDHPTDPFLPPQEPAPAESKMTTTKWTKRLVIRRHAKPESSGCSPSGATANSGFAKRPRDPEILQMDALLREFHGSKVYPEMKNMIRDALIKREALELEAAEAEEERRKAEKAEERRQKKEEDEWLEAEYRKHYRAICVEQFGVAIAAEIERIAQEFEERRAKERLTATPKPRLMAYRNYYAYNALAKALYSRPIVSRPQPQPFRKARPISSAKTRRSLNDRVDDDDNPIAPERPKLQAFRKARPYTRKLRSIAVDEDDGNTLAYRPDVPPPPTADVRPVDQRPKPQAFRKARPYDFAAVLRSMQSMNDEYHNPIAYRQEVPPLPVEVLPVEETVMEAQNTSPEVEDCSDNAIILTHDDWEQRLSEAKTRRKEDDESAQSDEEHSTGIIDTMKKWATGLWKKVKETFWG